MSKDPICGMIVEGEQFVHEIEGRKYFFCSRGCLDKFKNVTEKLVYDLLIIGAGPAGLSAAIHASVLKINTFLITRDIGGQAIDSAKIKDYTSFDFVSGKELIEKFKLQFLHQHYSDHKISEVVKINRVGTIFEVVTKEGSRITAFGLIIATGRTGSQPNTEFCQGLVKLNEKGEIIINADCSTNVEGVFACGEVTNCFGKRIIIAAGEGAKACLGIKQYLMGMGIE